MSIKEYYLDLYQALLDRDVLKFTKLRIFNIREQISYTSNSNNLVYKEIFGDKDADDFIDDLLDDEETNKVLFDHGFRAYENIFNVDICGTVYVKKSNYNDSEDTLDAIKHFLVTYIQNYDKSAEDCEQIVRIPQIIA